MSHLAEVNDSHPLNLTLNELKKSEVKVNQVFLGSLNLNSVNQLVADMLEFELDTVKSLSELIFRKTNGNPFFINQLLQTLYQRKLLCFNDERSCWTWKLEEINKIDITENVVSFLIKKINNLSTEAQKLLKIAACTGNSFELNILSLVYKKPQEKVSNILIEVVQEGLILPTNSCSSLIQNYNQVELNTYYCFVHDKIQQAAYSLLTANQKKLFHLQIGRVMLNYTYKNNVEENLFEIVNQFNLGIELVTHQNEIGQLARFNLLAGKKAKVSTAYESACQYLEKAQEILSKNRDTWKNYYKLMFSLSLELSECKYLSGRFEEAEEIFNLVLQQSKTKLEMAKVYILKINLYTDKGNLKQAIDIGLEAVKLFKITLPPKNIKLAISREIEKIQTKIGDQHIKDLYNLPEATDKNAVAIMNIFMSLAASTYFINLDLWALLMLKMINLSLKYGNTEVSSFAYSAYGLLIGSAFGNYQAGYEFGQLALEVNKKFNNLALNSKIYFMFGAFINHWKNHVSSDFDYLKKSFNFGNETGDPSFSSYASNILVAEMYIKGDYLNNVLKESKLYSDYVNKVKNIHGIYFQIVLQQIIFNLQGLTKNVFTWNTNKFNEKKYLDEITKLGLSNSIHFYYIAKIQTFFLFEDYLQAHQMAIESENMVKFSFGLLRVGEHYFYYSLTLLALYPSVNSKTQKSDWKLIVSHQKQLKKWADSCPQNFLHKYLLIAAEIARVSNKDLEAMDLYDQSIASARENEYTQNEAIANELAAKFYLTKGKAKIARLYMLDACYAYVKWGATAKVNDIKQKYSQLLETPPGTMLRGTNLPNDSIASEPLALDLFTVIKASQTLFGEIVLDKLLEKLMKTLIENAGAQKGYLILPLLEKSETEVHWVIEAVGSVDADGVTFLQSIPINSVPTCQTSLVSSAIVNYVARSHENVVLNDAAHEGQFTRTPYIVATQPKSILCAPLLHQGKLSGILYLENNLTTGAFTPERVEILRILSAQAAISIENSRLYEQLEDYNRTLEQKVYSRTQELQEKNEELANTLQKLKTTQAQIIAQEKLASLGALAAGIAHEIKNPLNFVNNFAELSVELSQELLEEIENQKERLDLKSKAYIEEILSDISQNAQKINDHGKRADNIVRGMLMLSREQSGKRQLTDIHALLEESVNLAYHGMRVKDRSFKVVVEADYDDELDQLNIVPQDLSRAFINIINNACYAANEKKKEGGKGFLPTLSISTKDLNEQVEIRIRDNGNGIPQEMFDKVFNPFFTTKTTWEGTGLGLSISHDIIVQRHQGEIKVESQLGYYTEFIINLPKNSHNKNSISEQT